MKQQKLKIYFLILTVVFVIGILFVFNHYLFAHEPPHPEILPCPGGYTAQKGTFYDDFTICQNDEYSFNARAEIRDDDLKLKYNWSDLTRVGQLETAGTLSVFVDGNYAYLGEAWGSADKFKIVNISNQANPQEVASLDFSGEWVKEVNDVFVSGNYAYLAITKTHPGYSTYLKIIDISNPSSPTTTATYQSYPSGPEFRTKARKIYVSGNYVYVTWRHGLEIINVSDKENPNPVYLFDSLDTSIDYSDLWVKDNYLYVGFYDYYDYNERKVGIRIYDVTDPSNPVLRGSFENEGSWIPDHLYLEGNYLYLTEAFDLRILDISDPSSPELVNEIDLWEHGYRSINDIFINNQKLFIIGDAERPDGRLEVLDVSDPSDPSEITSLQSNDLLDIREIFVSADSSLFAAHDQLPSTLKIYRYGFLTGQNNQGIMTTFKIDPIDAKSEIGSWDRIEIGNTLNQQSIIYQVLDDNNQLIPDGILPGNSSGFNASPTITTININTINPTVYPKLKLKVSFYTNDSFETPSINSWKVYWIKAKGTQSATTINVGQSVNFNAETSIGDSLIYKWDFDASNGFNWDNPDATGAQVSHTYQTAGTFTATLRIQQGIATAIDEKEFQITVNPVGGGGGGGGYPAKVVSSISIIASQNTVLADGLSTTTITAIVKDQNNDLITDSIPVNFSIVSGSGILISNQCLISQGQCSIVFQAPNQPDQTTIKACAADNVCAQITINLVETIQPKIELFKSVSPEGKVYPGEILTYRIDYQNKGDKATILIIQDKISLGTSYVSNSLIIDGQTESDEIQPLPTAIPLPKHGDYNFTAPNTVTFYLSLVEPDQTGYVSYQIKVNEDYLDKYYYPLCQDCQCLTVSVDKAPLNYFKIQTISEPRSEILPIYCPQICSSFCLSPSTIINQSKGIYDDQVVYSNLVSNEVVPKLNFISKIELVAEPKELLADGKSRADLKACIFSEENQEFRISAIAKPPQILPILPDLSGFQVYLNIIEGEGKLVSGAKSYLTDKNGCVYEKYQAGTKSGLVKIKAEVAGKSMPLEVIKQSQLFDIEEIRLLSINQPKIELFKSVSPEREVYPEETLIYRINYKNSGSVSTVGLIIEDLIPSGADYIPGSLVIDDQPEDDDIDFIPAVLQCFKVGHFDISNNLVRFIFSNCQIKPNQSGYVLFKVKVDKEAPVNSQIINRAEGRWGEPVKISYSNQVVSLVKKKEIGGPGGPGEIPSQEEPKEEPSIEIPPEEKPEMPLEEKPEMPPEEKPEMPPESVIQGISQDIIQPIATVYQQIRDNKIIQTGNQAVVVPASTAVAAVNLVASLPSVSTIPDLLKYLLDLIKLAFTQPALLLATKRKSWGTIYNALTKYPISLAAVRLYEIINGERKLIQSKVTGPDGRYFFLVKPGQKYKIEVSSADYNFPTKYLKEKLTDELFNNLYQGQEFIVSSEGLVNFNIPLDPKENLIDSPGFTKKIQIKPGLKEKEEYNLIRSEIRKRKISLIIASIAPILSAICLIISPGFYTGSLFVVHFIVWLLFRKFSQTLKPKSWGKTFELITNRPLNQVMVRLFAKPFDKLVAVQISDQMGRYGFLVGGEGEYYLVPVKPNYVFPREKLEIFTKEIPFIAKDLGMEKKV